jgi:hypothetical protein
MRSILINEGKSLRTFACFSRKRLRIRASASRRNYRGYYHRAVALLGAPDTRPDARTPAGFTTPTLDGNGFCHHMLVVRPGRPHYPILVHQAAVLLGLLSNRLTPMPLHFTNPSLPFGWIEDFHARHP